MDNDMATTWPLSTVESADKLDEKIKEVTRGAPPPPFAWRGQAVLDWQLQTTLDRQLLKTCLSLYEERLKFEKELLDAFAKEGKVYANEIEHLYLGNDRLTVLPLARHSGVPTRVLDWTSSPWVAAWFTCHEREHEESDAAIWWFSQGELDSILDASWDKWHVPLREHRTSTSKERDLTGMFKSECESWVTTLHYSIPFSRMQAQQAFMTVCGRLQRTHNDAIDELSKDKTITRGRIVIRGKCKPPILELLRTMNIHAQSLEYPGLDIVARKVGDRSPTPGPLRAATGTDDPGASLASYSTNTPDVWCIK